MNKMMTPAGRRLTESTLTRQTVNVKALATDKGEFIKQRDCNKNNLVMPYMYYSCVNISYEYNANKNHYVDTEKECKPT